MKSLTNIPVNYNGASFLLEIAEGKMMSLNTIYAAAGSPANREPKEWLRSAEAKRFIESISSELKVEKSRLLQVSRGRSGKTLAHWKIATKYAAYLAPALESAILDVFRERIQEELDPELAIQNGHKRAVSGWKRQGKNEDWIGVRVKSIDSWKSFTDTIKNQGIDGYGYPMCADSFNKPILGGTAKMVRQERNITKPNLRDELNEEELSEIDLAQIRAKKKIINDDVRGNRNCAKVCLDVSTKIAASR